jgi:molybdenum cofactor cytidylyltransferase
MAILILAAGSSRRMGDRRKQLLPWGEETLLRHTVLQAVGALPGAVYVVLGADFFTIRQHIEDLDVHVLYNPDHAEGLGTSIASGVAQLLAHSQPTHLLILLADQPQVSTSLIRTYIQESSANPSSIIATAYDRQPGVPAVFPAYFFPKLLALSGDSGAGKLLRTADEEVRKIHLTTPLYDIDTPQDYRRHYHEGD